MTEKCKKCGKRKMTPGVPYALTGEECMCAVHDLPKRPTIG